MWGRGRVCTGVGRGMQRSSGAQTSSISRCFSVSLLEFAPENYLNPKTRKWVGILHSPLKLIVSFKHANVALIQMRLRT